MICQQPGGSDLWVGDQGKGWRGFLFHAPLSAALRCGAMRCDAVRCGAMRCDAVRCGAMRCGAMHGRELPSHLSQLSQAPTWPRCPAASASLLRARRACPAHPALSHSRRSAVVKGPCSSPSSSLYTHSTASSSSHSAAASSVGVSSMRRRPNKSLSK